MKIFIAGARSMVDLPPVVQQKLFSIYQKGFEILIGDCYGIDTSVQQFYANLDYNNITIYASNGKARNNVGNWKIRAVAVADNVRGFDFYKQKDLVMSNDADYGFMIWDGESRGTLNNIINLAKEGKTVLVYHLSTESKMKVIKGADDLNKLIASCPEKTKRMCRALNNSVKPEAAQLTLI